MFLNLSVVAFGGEGAGPKSKLKIAPELWGAAVVVAVLLSSLNYLNKEEKARLHCSGARC